jgi:DNA-binding IclR family transcriptional regulator
VRQLGRAATAELAERLDLSATEVLRAVETLRRRRLVMQVGDDYVVVGAYRGG